MTKEEFFEKFKDVAGVNDYYQIGDRIVFRNPIEILEHKPKRSFVYTAHFSWRGSVFQVLDEKGRCSNTSQVKPVCMCSLAKESKND